MREHLAPDPTSHVARLHDGGGDAKCYARGALASPASATSALATYASSSSSGGGVAARFVGAAGFAGTSPGPDGPP
jgi:hypothetical protein